MPTEIGKNPPINKQVEKLQAEVEKLYNELEAQNKDKTQYENQKDYLAKKNEEYKEMNKNLQKIIEDQEKEIQKLANKEALNEVNKNIQDKVDLSLGERDFWDTLRYLAPIVIGYASFNLDTIEGIIKEGDFLRLTQYILTGLAVGMVTYLLNHTKNKNKMKK